MKLTISLAVAYLLLILIILIAKTVEEPKIITWNNTIMAESKQENEKNLEEFAEFININY